MNISIFFIIYNCITSHDITSHHIISHRNTPYHITSLHITPHNIASHRIASYRIVSHCIASHHIISLIIIIIIIIIIITLTIYIANWNSLSQRQNCLTYNCQLVTVRLRKQKCLKPGFKNVDTDAVLHMRRLLPEFSSSFRLNEDRFVCRLKCGSTVVCAAGSTVDGLV